MVECITRTACDVITHLRLSNGCSARRLVACPPIRDRFAAGRGYLAACTLGLPADVTVDAVRRDLERWAAGTAERRPSTRRPSSAPAGTPRRCSASTPGASPRDRRSRCSPGSPRHPPPPAPRCCASTATSRRWSRPFLARGDLRVRHVPLDRAGRRGQPPTRGWSSYSLVQSATGEVADAASVTEAAHGRRRTRARRHHAGHRLDADHRDLDADLIVCHAYKWLCAPRGAAFAAFSPRAIAPRSRRTRPAGTRAPTPGHPATAPTCTSPRTPDRFDVSPAWHAWVGAEAALGFAASLDADEVRDHAVGLANAFRERLEHGALEQRDRHVARRRRHRRSRALSARGHHRLGTRAGAPGSRSTSGTTTRTSTSPRRRSVAERADAAAAAQRAARTGFDSVPRPETVTSTVSPSTMGPTPAGVPVRITSPGSRVNTLDA